MRSEDGRTEDEETGDGRSHPSERPAWGALDDQIAVVTGADSGIGRAIAIEFARQGASVCITYNSDEEGAAETKRAVEEAGARALVRRLDVREQEQVESVFAATVEELGTPTILVNNAGINAQQVELEDSEPETWRKVLDIDLFGPYLCCRKFVELRSQAGGRGKVINVTSVHELIPTPGGTAYDAAKGGLRNLTRTLALEVAEQRINVNAIAPGMILTPMNQESVDDEDVRAKKAENIPWKRAGEPWEVARMALYLASRDADYVTGQSFFIDGGLSINIGQGA